MRRGEIDRFLDRARATGQVIGYSQITGRTQGERGNAVGWLSRSRSGLGVIAGG
jgi:hypothetical protein